METIAEQIKFNVGETVLISPQITNVDNWLKGTIIQLEDNIFNGLVISAKAENGLIYFHQAKYFKKM
jgi:hypothetical protein